MPRSPRQPRSPVGPPRRWTTCGSSPRSWWRHNDVPTLRLTVESSSGRFTVSSRSNSGASWTRHATGRIVDGLVRPTLRAAGSLPGPSPPRADELYPRLAERGLVYGPAFRRIVDAQRRATAACWLASTPPTPESPPPTTRPTPRCWTPPCSASRCWPGPMTHPTAGPSCPPRYGTSGSSPPYPIRSWSGVTRLAPAAGRGRSWSPTSCSPTADGQVLIELHRVQFRPINPRPPVLE